MAGPAARTWPTCCLTGRQRGGFESHNILVDRDDVRAVMRNERLDVKRWVRRMRERISVGIRCFRRENQALKS